MSRQKCPALVPILMYDSQTVEGREVSPVGGLLMAMWLD